MKNFEFLLCFLLCVVPCVFTQNETSNVTTTNDMDSIARNNRITRPDLQECLDGANSDLDTMMNLTSLSLKETTTQSQELNKKVGCFGVCIYKKNGAMVNNKILPEKVLEYLSDQDTSQEDIKFMRKSFIDCSNLASSLNDECEIVLSFSRCVLQKIINRTTI